MELANIKIEDDDLTPVTPSTLEETQLEFNFLVDLALKAVYADANTTTVRISEKLCLPIQLTEMLLQHLYKEKLIEIRSQRGIVTRYAMLDRGWERVNRLLELNGYIGPAPVSLKAYTEMVLQQDRQRQPVLPKNVNNALAGLVLPDITMQTLGLVSQSRRSLFLFGEPGNGKTSIGMALHNAQPGEIWIPYAIEVDGQIIKVYDKHNHTEVAAQCPHDKRWIKIRRPMVVVGGEMTIQSMDLVYSHTVRHYEAPFQLKANGGTLLIDDFGRQRVDPTHLLNRWIIPLERGVDYLTLHTGKKIEVPFEPLLIFATNLDLNGLVDEAFLRRMGYRVYVAPPTLEHYGTILEKTAEEHGLPYDRNLLRFLWRRYNEERRPLRCCEPRDLVHHVMDLCKYNGQKPELNQDLLNAAWINYFGRTGTNSNTVSNLRIGVID